MAWKNGKIAAVGDAEELFTLFPGAGKIDGGGRTVLPGFVDPHNHFVWGVLFHNNLSCSFADAPSIDALKQRLFEFAKTHRKGEWIVGHGYDSWAYKGRRPPTRKDLDEACPDNPVVIVHFSVHECVANTRALMAAGIDRKSPQPFGGVIKKDWKGNPTGYLIELAMTNVEKVARENMIKQTGPHLFQKILDGQNRLLGLGITRMCDPAVSPDLEIIYKQSAAQGAIKMPIVMNPSSETGLSELPGMNFKHEPTGKSEGLLTVGPLKLFMDGAHQCCLDFNLIQQMALSLVTGFRSITSLSADPIKLNLRSEFRFSKDLHLHSGLFTSTKKNYLRIAKASVDNGLGLCIHAIGNEAISYAADVVASVRNRHPDTVAPRIEHGFFITDDLIKKAADLGINVVSQPNILIQLPKANVPYLYKFKHVPLKSFIGHGIITAASSDWPVENDNPFLGIERAVTRRTVDDEYLDKDEALSVMEALTLYTRNGAKVLGCDHEAGSLETGKIADFIFVSDNPLKVNPDDLGKIRVLETYVAGEQVFPERQADESTAVRYAAR